MDLALNPEEHPIWQAMDRLHTWLNYGRLL